MLAYLSENADNRIIEALKQEGFEIKLLAPFCALCVPTDTHADMLLCAVGNTLFVHKDYTFKTNDFDKVIRIDEPISNQYPNDILLNIAIVGKNAFCNTKHASKKVLKYLESNGFLIHHVAQGYANCSTCIVNDNAIITANEGIANAARKAGVDVLKINAGHISLPPYDFGFIGGASGVTDSAVYFCGSLKYHPEGEKIRLFINDHGKKVVELYDAPLYDIGGIIFK